MRTSLQPETLDICFVLPEENEPPNTYISFLKTKEHDSSTSVLESNENEHNLVNPPAISTKKACLFELHGHLIARICLPKT